MNWFRENPFVAGLTAFTVVAVGALAFLASQAMGQYGELADQYTAAVGKLHQLQNRSPFPNQENLQKTKALEAAYKSELTALQNQLTKLEPPLNPEVRPQQFQDDLRAAVTEVTEKATAAGVKLPEDFFLGFNQYVNSPPEDRAAPALARQLAVIKGVVLNLIEVRVQSIDALTRRPLPEEKPAVANAPKAPIVQRFLFDIAFTGDQSKFRVIFNQLLRNDQFLVVRAVNVANTAQEGPAVNQQATAATSVPGIPGLTDSSTPETKELNVVLGRELVRVALRLEMIDFTTPAPEAKK
jgi:hypothetical protein